jgi:signal transduction histidine kinase
MNLKELKLQQDLLFQNQTTVLPGLILSEVFILYLAVKGNADTNTFIWSIAGLFLILTGRFYYVITYKIGKLDPKKYYQHDTIYAAVAVLLSAYTAFLAFSFLNFQDLKPTYLVAIILLGQMSGVVGTTGNSSKLFWGYLIPKAIGFWAILFLGIGDGYHKFASFLILTLIYIMASANMEIQKYIANVKNLNMEVGEKNKYTALGEMASGIAHEINNPLFVIRGSIDKINLLKKRGKLNEEKLTDVLERIKNAANKANDIVRSLKTMSGFKDLEEGGTVCINDVLNDVVNIQKNKLDSEGIFLFVKKPTENFYVKGEFAQIGQILMNLIKNARDELIQHQIERVIDVDYKTNEGYFQIFVSDSGPGIALRIERRSCNPSLPLKTPTRGQVLGWHFVRSMLRPLVESSILPISPKPHLY